MRSKSLLDNVMAAVGVVLFGTAFGATAIGIKALIWAIYSLN